ELCFLPRAFEHLAGRFCPVEGACRRTSFQLNLIRADGQRVGLPRPAPAFSPSPGGAATGPVLCSRITWMAASAATIEMGLAFGGVNGRSRAVFFLAIAGCPIELLTAALRSP